MRVPLRVRSITTRSAIVAALALTAITLPRAATVGRSTLGIQGRTNASVSLASGGGLIVATWAASAANGDTDIYAAVSRDGGVSFPAPVRVNSTPGDASVNNEQPPRATIAPRPGGTPPLITVVWTSKNQQGSTLVHARSEDGGRSFARTALVPDGAAAGNRGWENAAVDRQGRTRVVWLDHRDMAQPAGGSASSSGGGAPHVHNPANTAGDGGAMAQKSRLFVATLGEGGSARSSAAGVCYCCKTAIVSAPDDTLYMAWRHVYPGNLRDIAFTFSRDGGRTFAPPIKVSDDRWMLDGCPDDGPAMTADAANRVHIAWPTLVQGADGKPAIGIFYAQSRDGRTFGPRERLATEGLPHHPQILVNGDRLFVAWDELKDGVRRIVLATRPAATTSAGFTRTVVAEASGLLYPSLAPSGAGALVAWSVTAERAAIQLARVE